MIVYLNLFPATPCKESSNDKRFLQCIYKNKYCNLFINFTNVKNQVLHFVSDIFRWHGC